MADKMKGLIAALAPAPIFNECVVEKLGLAAPNRPVRSISVGKMLVIGAAAMVIAASPPQPTAGRIAYVTDGDTFRLESGERIRIAGIDAAETQQGNAKCASELVIGAAAKRRAIALLKGRAVTFERVGRSYNRTVAEVRLDGRDLATMLVDGGIARWWPHGKPKPDWCGL